MGFGFCFEFFSSFFPLSLMKYAPIGVCVMGLWIHVGPYPSHLFPSCTGGMEANTGRGCHAIMFPACTCGLGASIGSSEVLSEHC